MGESPGESKEYRIPRYIFPPSCAAIPYHPFSTFLSVAPLIPGHPGTTHPRLYNIARPRCTLELLICSGGSRSSVSPSSRAVVFLFGGSQSLENRLYRDHLTRPIGELTLSAIDPRAGAREPDTSRRVATILRRSISRERSLAPASRSAISRGLLSHRRVVETRE